jgi:phage shock protein E
MLKFIKSLFKSNTDEVKEMLKNGAVIIDVRTPGEFASGHNKGAVNIPLDSIGSKLSEIKKKYKKPVVTVCASGMRSARAASILNANGINAINGGGWRNIE